MARRNASAEFTASGKVTGELVRRFGVRAMQGREFERDWPQWFEVTG